jgi:peptide/nickel transport system permease protein
VVTLSFLGSSIPGFFLAMLLIYLFTVKLGWLPSGGMTTLGTSGGAADVAVHMVMPVIVLAVSMAGTNIRYIRSAVLETAGLSAHSAGKGNRSFPGHQ